MKTIYQVVIINHETCKVKFCGDLYESREKALRDLFGFLDNPYIEPCGEVGEQKYTVESPRTFVSFDVEVCAQRERNDTHEVIDYCIVEWDLL